MRRRAVTYLRTPRRKVFGYQLVGRATTNFYTATSMFHTGDWANERRRGREKAY